MTAETTVLAERPTAIAASAERMLSLKDRLDAIDEQAVHEAVGGYYKSRLCILLAMWEKGEAIAAQFRGGKMRTVVSTVGEGNW